MSSKDCDTPPSSDIDIEQSSPRLPLSPPLSPKNRSRSSPSIAPVDRLIGLLRLHRSGRLPCAGDWQTFPLTPAEFEAFLAQLEKQRLREWFEAKVRYDYDGGTLTLRMPSAVHERFTASVEDRIFSAIEDLAERLVEEQHDEIATALKCIYKGRSTTLELHAPKLENSSQESDAAEKVLRRSPDATFYCIGGDGEGGAGLPALVVEVSYSQQRKDLPRLAESYIVDSRHAIRCVVGLDITYTNAKGKVPKDHTATVSVWRPEVVNDEEGDEVGVCACDVHEMPFRGSQGITCEGEIQLTLADLLPKPILEKLPATAYDEHIVIPFSDLGAFLYKAELDATPRPKPIAASPKKFRKRKRTPSEDLSDGRESSFVKQEDAVAEKERHADQDWRESRQRVKTEPLAGTPTEVVERRSKRSASGRAVAGAS